MRAPRAMRREPGAAPREVRVTPRAAEPQITS
jgi:hypothetical protein